MIVAKWCLLTAAEMKYVVGAIRAGVSGDVLCPSGRWYHVSSGKDRG